TPPWSCFCPHSLRSAGFFLSFSSLASTPEIQHELTALFMWSQLIQVVAKLTDPQRIVSGSMD
ncbi:MAG: hypothetical protein ACXU7H_01040, partial [Burkholderiaceae bacterium]